MRESRTFRSLRHRNARLFFVGLLVSQVGTWLQLTAMSLLVYRLTGKGTDVGITLLCQFLPMLLLGVQAGVLADRIDRRKLTLWTQAAQAAHALLLGALVLAGWESLGLIYVMSLVLGVISAVDNPARRGLVLELAEPAEIGNALSLNTAVMTCARIFGPALAAALVDPLGPGWLFMINGISFTAILVPIMMIDASKLHRAPPMARGGQPVREAMRFVRSNRRLLVSFIVFAVVSTFAFNQSVSLLKIADDRFDRASNFGWLLALDSVGAVIGSLLTARRRQSGSMWLYQMAVLMALGGFAVAWAPSIWIAFAACVPYGIGGAAFVAGFNVISQEESPPDMRGRLLALGSVAFLGSTPIGGPLTGWIADHVSAEWSLGYGSVVTLIAVAFGAWDRYSATHSVGGAVPAGEHVAATAGGQHADGGGVVVEGDPGLAR